MKFQFFGAKRIVFLAVIFSVFLAVPASAQDAKAKSILENASKKMKEIKSLKANFTLKLVSKGVVKDTKKGNFNMQGDKYHITIASQEIICDGKTVWTFMKDAGEVQISAYNPDEQNISPTKLFTDFYDKEYNYSFIGTKNVAGKLCTLIAMVPVSKSKPFTKVELAFDKNYNITGGTITEKNGNQYQYEVNGLTSNVSMPEKLFSFDTKAHPGIEIIDLR